MDLMRNRLAWRYSGGDRRDAGQDHGHVVFESSGE
jgi:hypothetical protein